MECFTYYWFWFHFINDLRSLILFLVLLCLILVGVFSSVFYNYGIGIHTQTCLRSAVLWCMSWAYIPVDKVFRCFCQRPWDYSNRTLQSHPYAQTRGCLTHGTLYSAVTQHNLLSWLTPFIAQEKSSLGLMFYVFGIESAESKCYCYCWIRPASYCVKALCSEITRNSIHVSYMGDMSATIYPSLPTLRICISRQLESVIRTSIQTQVFQM